MNVDGIAGLPQGRVTVPDHVVHRPFEQETVLLNTRTGQYHGLNPVGGMLLDELSETGDAAESARRVAERYDVPFEVVAADLVELCDALLARGLIEIDE